VLSIAQRKKMFALSMIVFGLDRATLFQHNDDNGLPLGNGFASYQNDVSLSFFLSLSLSLSFSLSLSLSFSPSDLALIT
jgi:hypothetical protein